MALIFIKTSKDIIKEKKTPKTAIIEERIFFINLEKRKLIRKVIKGNKIIHLIKEYSIFIYISPLYKKKNLY